MAKKRAKSEEPKKTVKSEEPKKKKPISLNILEIAKRIQKLEQTAGMPSEYPATQVMLSDGDSVEDRVDAHTLGPAVNLTFEINYTAPSDGYIIGAASAGSGNYVTLAVGGVYMARVYSGGSNLSGYASAFVKKGMTVFFSGNSSSTASATFRPLT